MRRRTLPLLILGAVTSLAACDRWRGQGAAVPESDDDGWSVTAWGDVYEVFAETEALAAGQVALSTPHVTTLADYKPMRSGKVTIVLRSSAGAERAFATDQPKHEGIFPVRIEPPAAGEYELFFEIASAAGQERIAAGRVRVGTTQDPGGAVDAPQPAADSVSFLKDQQWRTRFATAWSEVTALADSVSGPAQVRPTAGGEALLTAPADAVMGSQPWPYRGLEFARGGLLFRLLPRMGDRSLPELQAEAETLALELEAARRRVERLAALLEVEASSAAELERARTAAAALEARLAAARQGLRASAASGDAARSIALTAPWAGRVAEVSVSPGQSVAAGAPLARIVRTRPLWLEVALAPEDAARVRAGRVQAHVRRPGGVEPLTFSSARLIARAPEVDARTGSLAVVLEIDATTAELPIGTAVEAELLLDGTRRGVVVPLSTVVQDGGLPVAYVQLEGERFARRELRILARQGSLALVEGLRAGERVVTLGGGALRRASLLSSGAPEGHVH